MRRLPRALLAILIALAAFGAAPARADGDGTLWSRIGFDQRLGDRLPLAARFVDDAGRDVTLAAALRGRAAVLVLNYYDCPNLCSVVLQGTFEALARVGLEPGRDFELVAVSIDPRETPALAARTKADYLRRYRSRDAAAAASGIHFLTGPQASIDALTRAAGFRYFYDDALKQYAHPAGIVIVAPDGRISRYLFGARYTTLSLRLALVEAAGGGIGTLADQIWLLCYHYDPAQGRYGFAIVTALKVFGSGTVIALGGYLFFALRRERRKRPVPEAA